MHGALFHLDLGVWATTSERARQGRALAAVLAALPGLVAFVALEAEDGTMSGLCICMDEQALVRARQKADEWQRACAGEVMGDAEAAFSLEPTFIPSAREDLKLTRLRSPSNDAGAGFKDGKTFEPTG